MACSCFDVCGGCSYRNMDEQKYQQLKIEKLHDILLHLKEQNYRTSEPIFIADGKRRRATLNFYHNNKGLSLGFNEKSSHNIVNIDNCDLLTPRINACIPKIKDLLTELCALKYTVKQRKNFIVKTISSGDILISEADNGLDIVLEYDAPVDINARMIIAEFCQADNDIIRISHRRNIEDNIEILLQKAVPLIKMGKFDVKIPAGTFLQASKDGELALAQLVVKYLKGIKGKIADLFCGVGTFSYYITSETANVNILSVDCGADLLDGFANSINSNKITNIEIRKQNLFKYPLTANETEEFAAIVFDPPRAGAKEQCRLIASSDKKPPVIVAVSCNPLSFVRDANILIDGGYKLKEITLVDQFVYSDHCELVALFSL